jgi:catechol 2,3-dioxygenase-like lactoylglutathione lyase family enzyme
MTDEARTQITDVRTVAVPVTDQDRALAFYTGKLGFEKRMDVLMGDGRWIEVAPPGAAATIALVPSREGAEGAGGAKSTEEAGDVEGTKGAEGADSTKGAAAGVDTMRRCGPAASTPIPRSFAGPGCRRCSRSGTRTPTGS